MRQGPRRPTRRPSSAQDAADKDAAQSSGVEQSADIRGPAHIVGSGSQYNVNLTLSDESIMGLLPELERLLTELSDALAVIHEAAGEAQPPPDLRSTASAGPGRNGAP